MNLDYKSFIRKLKLLPVLIVVASFGFVVRLGDTYISLKTMSGSAYAEDAQKPMEAAQATTPASPVAEPPTGGLKSGDEKPENDEITLPSTEPAASPQNSKWQDASDTDIADSNLKNEVFQDLIKRRDELDKRERTLSEREALLEAAQKELDKKLSEMEGIRDELKDLLKQQTAEEAMRIQSLVKIYSGMKPKDAARIFNTLDTDILMDVIGSMTESKSGPIIALMDADRAKALTTLLAEQKKLPEMP